MERVDELIEKAYVQKKVYLSDLLDLGLTYEDYNLLIECLESKDIKIIENYANTHNNQEVDFNYVSDSLIQYFNEVSTMPLLDGQEEKILFYEYSRTKNSEIRERLICSNLRLVIKIAFEYRWRLKNNANELLDLIQEGNKGLMKAIEKYDVTLGKRFSVYAPWWIRYFMKSALNDMTGSIKLPVNMAETYWRIQGCKYGIKKETGESVSDFEVASLLGISDKRARTVISNGGYHFMSIDEFVSKNNNKTNHEFISDVEQMTIEDIVVNKMEFEIIEKIMKTKLTPREYFIVSCRNGIINEVNKFAGAKRMEEIGKLVGISRQRVKQILDEAYKKIKEEYERQNNEINGGAHEKVKKI